MARVKSITARRHRQILKLAKGYRQARRRRFRAAQEAILHAGAYAYAGRKLRKRQFRKLWIIRINAAARKLKLSYNKLMSNLKEAKITIDRKILSEIATSDFETFKKIVQASKQK